MMLGMAMLTIVMSSIVMKRPRLRIAMMIQGLRTEARAVVATEEASFCLLVVERSGFLAILSGDCPRRQAPLRGTASRSDAASGGVVGTLRRGRRSVSSQAQPPQATSHRGRVRP